MRELDINFVLDCRKSKMSWNSIARLHGVCARTLYRWRQENNFQEPLQIGTKVVVIPLVENFLRDQPWRGEQSLLAHLRSAPHFIWISLINLRIIINEVDPNGREHRKKKCINRRVYNAPGSGYVHHCDTHHKLGRWGLVTFGAIDGYSHKVIALNCSIDNKAITLLRAYCSSPGIKENGFPEFMRGDYGGENVAIARCLNSVHQEVGRFIFGKSIHNQRIERLWGDVHTQVTRSYRNRFLDWETNLGLELLPENIWVIQYLFLERINKDLEQFVNTWNCHAMSTEKHLCPNAIQLTNQNNRYSLDRMIDEDGINNVIASLEEEYEGKKVAENISPFISAHEYVEFKNRVSVINLEEDNNQIYDKPVLAYSVIREIKFRRNV